MSGQNKGVSMGFVISENRQLPDDKMVVDHDNMTAQVSNIYPVVLNVFCTPDNFDEQVDWCINYATNHVLEFIDKHLYNNLKQTT